MNALVRPQQGRWLAGVCVAIAHRFGVSAMTVRILALLAFFVFGLSLWAYIIMWIVIPSER